MTLNDDKIAENLAAADQDIENARSLVRAQEILVSRLRAAGVNTRSAEDLLKAFMEGERLAMQRKERLLAT